VHATIQSVPWDASSETVEAFSRAQAVAPFRIATLSGGVSRNAIPRDAQATVTVPEAGESDFRRAVEAELADIRAQHAESDPGAVVAIAPAEVHTAASAAVSARVLDLLAALPSGVIAPHPRLAGVVETSTSLNVASTEGATVTLAGMSRSASSYALEDVVRRIEALARLAGATVDVKRSYPPWEPDLDSPLLAAARSTFSRLFDTEPRLDVVHGGLECAVIGAGLPGVQMISIGPTIEGPHAPGERLGIASTERFYRLLVALLDDLSS
jgi:dipeptidase D